MNTLKKTEATGQGPTDWLSIGDELREIMASDMAEWPPKKQKRFAELVRHYEEKNNPGKEGARALAWMAMGLDKWRERQ